MGISFGAAYSSSDRTHNQLAAARSSQRYANGDKADAWTVGAKYDANNIYLAAMYAETRNMTFYGNDSFGGIANKTQNFEVVAQYQFDDFNLPLRPSVAYLQSKGKDLYAYSRYGDKDLVKYVDVGMTYYFNKNMSTYVDYKINLLDEDDRFYKNSGIATDDIVALGLVYQFLIPVKARVQRAFLCSRSVEITLFDIAAFQAYLPSLLMRLSSFGLKAAIRCQKDKARYRDSTLKPGR
ncbi:outer membrane protein N [Klebsiella pneumoniae subsp. rhinoscleromatis]|nr:outer membrane protein N [Klebsiella pneumoniae subsp. rhinoscleromatis]